ncbi:hypothetical protein TNCT_233101 [Trichonephila clavata]|uniref:Uncharacterized protein n=1 Tax=Trichonephila clavata TaxID=2740835 RepID=A0A8X6IAD8_TRICU|nr:hypothetical protein TNCT_233101 [Trichonephila clavata]
MCPKLFKFSIRRCGEYCERNSFLLSTKGSEPVTCGLPQRGSLIYYCEFRFFFTSIIYLLTKAHRMRRFLKIHNYHVWANGNSYATSSGYLAVLQQVKPKLLNLVSEDTTQCMGFQHDRTLGDENVDQASGSGNMYAKR